MNRDVKWNNQHINFLNLKNGMHLKGSWRIFPFFLKLYLHSSVFLGKSTRYSLDKKKKGDHSFLEKCIWSRAMFRYVILDQTTTSYHNFNSSKGTDLGWLFFEQNFLLFFVCFFVFFVTKSTLYFCWQVQLRFVFVLFINLSFCASHHFTFRLI